MTVHQQNQTFTGDYSFTIIEGGDEGHDECGIYCMREEDNDKGSLTRFVCYDLR